jgi:hypothetical protein
MRQSSVSKFEWVWIPNSPNKDIFITTVLHVHVMMVHSDQERNFICPTQLHIIYVQPLNSIIDDCTSEELDSIGDIRWAKTIRLIYYTEWEEKNMRLDTVRQEEIILVIDGTVLDGLAVNSRMWGWDIFLQLMARRISLSSQSIIHQTLAYTWDCTLEEKS